MSLEWTRITYQEGYIPADTDPFWFAFGQDGSWWFKDGDGNVSGPVKPAWRLAIEENSSFGKNFGMEAEPWEPSENDIVAIQVDKGGKVNTLGFRMAEWPAEDRMVFALRELFRQATHQLFGGKYRVDITERS